MKAARVDSHFIALIGRDLIALVFLYSGIDKIRNIGPTSGVMRAHGIPFVPVALTGAIVLEIACGLLLLINLFSPIAAALLVLFVIVSVITIPLRDLRGITDPKALHLAQVALAGNMGVVGGLLLIIGTTM